MFVTSPLVRWTWSSLGQEKYEPKLVEFRPSDSETVREMLEGRYLLAGRLIDTQGASPFAVHVDHPGWNEELNSFSWLRHFQDTNDPAGRGLARTLVLDWISRNATFRDSDWKLTILAQRLMNWFRHFSLICEGATGEQIGLIYRSIGLQVQSAKLRSRLAFDPVDELMGHVILVGAALSDGSTEASVLASAESLCDKLEDQLGKDGFHRSRNPEVQLDLLVELVTLRLALTQRSGKSVRRLVELVEKMHRALDAVTLSTGEPGYFNGCGQLPTEIIIAVQGQGPSRQRGNALTAGYGLVIEGNASLLLDSGRIPPTAYAANAHSSALAFEFSYGNQLIAGNCGPAPAELYEHADAFRQAVAHSGPSINGEGASRVEPGGGLHSFGDKPFIEVSKSEATIAASTSGFQSRFGVRLERRVNLISDGQSLVGQDRLVGKAKRGDNIMSLSFHLGPGIEAEKVPDTDMIMIRLPNMDSWTFLWEGADAHIEDSVRHSRNIGFHRTRQIVLAAPVETDAEIAWIFTRQAR